MIEAAPVELVLDVGPAANGGSCVARHDGRVVFVRYALPGERVRARVTGDRGSYWHAEAVEIIRPAAERIDPLCPVAGVGGAGCCDLSFIDPVAARELKGQVVANQLARLGQYTWEGVAESLGDGDPCGWRTRVRLGVGEDGRAGLHRYHSNEVLPDLRCAQVPDGLLDGVAHRRWRPGEQIHVALDSDGTRHIGATMKGRRGIVMAEGSGVCVQRVGRWQWRLPLTAFWQSHREAPAVYTDAVTRWTGGLAGARAWDLFGGAGLFAAVLGDAVGASGEVASVDTARDASAVARVALAGVPGLQVVSQSVRRFLHTKSAESETADVAVIDPPRAGAGREIIELLAAAEVSRVVHIGCEAAAFARDIGLYRRNGFTVTHIRVFDAFPLTHHVECIALLTRSGVPDRLEA